jgi:hypothetical protein
MREGQMGTMSGVDALDDLFARVHLRTLEPERIILAGAFNDIATSSRTATGPPRRQSGEPLAAAVRSALLLRMFLRRTPLTR